MATSSAGRGGRGPEGFQVTFTYQSILDRLDRIEAQLDRISGRDSAYKVMAGIGMGSVPAAIVTYLLTR